MIRLDVVGSRVVGAAGETTTVHEFGRAIVGEVGRVLPHDGYILGGMDPVTGVASFHTRENGYSAETVKQMSIDFAHGRTGPVRVLAHGMADQHRYHAQLHHMATDGFGSEIRVELTHGGRTWGVLILLREHGRTPFTLADVTHAQHLVRPLVRGLKRFVANTPLRPARSAQPPGVIILGPDDEITATTPPGRAAIRAFTPEQARVDGYHVSNVCEIAHRVRRAGQTVVCRVLTPQGWVAMHAQLLDGTTVGEVAITTQPASAQTLLPAIAAWYDITPREHTVITHALEGLPTKQIARHLVLSEHTVNHHFRAIYRKIGVTSREELIANLSG